MATVDSLIINNRNKSKQVAHKLTFKYHILKDGAIELFKSF